MPMGTWRQCQILKLKKHRMLKWYEFECPHVKIYLGWSCLECKIIYEKKWNVWVRDFHLKMWREKWVCRLPFVMFTKWFKSREKELMWEIVSKLLERDIDKCKVISKWKDWDKNIECLIQSILSNCIFVDLHFFYFMLSFLLEKRKDNHLMYQFCISVIKI